MKARHRGESLPPPLLSLLYILSGAIQTKIPRHTHNLSPTKLSRQLPPTRDTSIQMMHILNLGHSASNVSASLNQKSWTLYKMYWRLANGILMGTLRSESWGVYDCGGSNKWFI